MGRKTFLLQLSRQVAECRTAPQMREAQACSTAFSKLAHISGPFVAASLCAGLVAQRELASVLAADPFEKMRSEQAGYLRGVREARGSRRLTTLSR